MYQFVVAIAPYAQQDIVFGGDQPGNAGLKQEQDVEPRYIPVRDALAG